MKYHISYAMIVRTKLLHQRFHELERLLNIQLELQGFQDFAFGYANLIA